ncbi:MAG: hypothetical protein COA88_03855 [Kordia sp.]|nr:MAG: hypothetical protein COA88_03855 [Kordia sp.]
MRIGENYQNNGSNDTYIDTCVSLGWHNSGNFDAKGGAIEIKGTDILFRGPSGNFAVYINIT